MNLTCKNHTRNASLLAAFLTCISLAVVPAAAQTYTLTVLGSLGGNQSFGLAVNASGQVAGYSYTAGNSAEHAFLSAANGGTLTDLGTLGGSVSVGYGVNASGQVAGTSDISGNSAEHAFLSAANGGALKDLGTLGGSTSFGQAVNASGQVVGVSAITGNNPAHAFLYSGGVMTDLNSLIAPDSAFILTEALGISDTGFITGIGINSLGQTDAFLLTPQAVPEASSVVSLGILFALGLGGLAVSAKRRNASAAV